MPITREQNYQVRTTAPLLRGGLSMIPNYDAQYSGIGNNTWTSVCWSPALNLFCAVASDGTDRIMTSPDGEAWTVRTTPIVLSWVSVVWSTVQAKFIAVASDSASGGGKNNNHVVSSSNGIDWVHHDVPTVRIWKALAVLDNDPSSQVVIVSTTGHILGGSTADGTILDTWVESVDGTYQYNCVSAFGTTSFVAAGEGNRFVKIVYGSPALTLTKYLVTPPIFSWRGICWSQSSSKLFAVSAYRDQYESVLAYSSDGLTWTRMAPREGIDARSLSCFDIGLLYATGNTTDTSEILVNDAYEFGVIFGAPTQQVGQTFVVPDLGGIMVSSVVMYLKVRAGALEDREMYVDIRRTSAGLPTSLWGSSLPVNKNTLTTSYEAITFDMQDLALERSRTYAFVLRIAGAAFSQWVTIEGLSVGYGRIVTWADGDGYWLEEEGSMCRFAISMTNKSIYGDTFPGAMTCYAPSQISLTQATGVIDATGVTDLGLVARGTGAYGVYDGATGNNITIQVAPSGAYETLTISDGVTGFFYSTEDKVGNDDGYAGYTGTSNVTGNIKFAISRYCPLVTVTSGANVYTNELTVGDYQLAGGLDAADAIWVSRSLAAGGVTDYRSAAYSPTLGRICTVGGASISGATYGAIYTHNITQSMEEIFSSMDFYADEAPDPSTYAPQLTGAESYLASVTGTLFGITGQDSEFGGIKTIPNGIILGGSTGLNIYDEGTFTPTSTYNSGTGGYAPITVNWANYTRVGSVCFIDMSITWGAQNADQIAAPVTLGGLPFDGRDGFYQFLSIDEARDTEAYSVYYHHNPYVFHTEINFKPPDDMLYEWDSVAPEAIALQNGLAGRTTRLSGFYFVA